MSRIARFLTNMILARFITILACTCIFVLTLESVGFISEILTIHPSPTQSLAHYAIFRSPSVLSVFLPISMLLALLLTITELTYRNEITAIFAIGISPIRIILMLLPLALLIGGFHFILLDRLIPAVTPTLKIWGIGDYAKSKLNVGNKDPIWIRSGPDIMRISKVSGDGKQLTGIIVFKRNDHGRLKEQIYADEATLEDARWRLQKVVVYYTGNENPIRMESLIYSGALQAASANRTGDPDDMTLSELNSFIANEGYGVRPVHVYQTNWHKRLAALVITLVMIMLCVPMAAKFRRGGGLGYLFVMGVGLGFLFFVSDGISTTMGELGLVAPWLSAWAPVLFFAALGVSFVARTERA